MKSWVILMLVAAAHGCGKSSLQGEADAQSDAPAICSIVSACAPEGLYPGPCIKTHLVGPERTVMSSSSYGYDLRCRLTIEELDFDGDGLTDLTVTYERDDAGVLFRETRVSSDGFVEVLTYSYDRNGTLILMEADLGADGTVDYHAEYDTDLLGNVIEERWYEGSQLTEWTVTTYDDAGRVAMVEEHRYLCIDWSVFTGEIVARRTTYTYDEAGNLFLEERDGVECEATDGDIDLRIERTHDTSGNVLTENVDGSEGIADRVDGSLDMCTTYAYNDRSNLTRIEVDGRTSPCDGVVDSVTIQKYEGGLLTRIEYDRDADGAAEDSLSYLYDPCGNLFELSSWREGEGTVWFDTQSYDCWE